MPLNYVQAPRGPFLLFSMGLPGYAGENEGENTLWDLKDGEEITVFHILARIKHEMEMAGKGFYLFGTHRNFVRPKDEFVANYGKIPIPILFTVNLSERLKMPKDLDCGKLLRSPLRCRKMIAPRNGVEKKIPKEIQLWGDDPYYGLRIKNFNFFEPTEERFLNAKNLTYYLNDNRLKSWNRFTMGLLYVGSNGNHRVEDRRILATAELEPPYIYRVK